MTTEIGIVSEEKFENEFRRAVTLASDKARTTTSWKPHGDLAYKQQQRSEGQKIFIDNNNDFAVCMSGIYDERYEEFLYGMIRGKLDVKKALLEGCFMPLAELNVSRWEGRMPEDNFNSLLIASRFESKPKLYTCWPLGKVEERYFTSIGSGSKYALPYIQKKAKAIPYAVSLENSIDLAVEGIKAASEDIYTGGLDIVIVTEKEIIPFGKEIDENVNSALNKSILDIKSRLGRK